ncbi:alpha/beta hydrolase [Sinorhizobium meliloti]|uniref:Chloride peroxidase n=1 Tax=Sinorhizobium meliloti (strain SM11) TaxID=707241 RepID=F7XJF6_SINMM|nr:alpha/beta hydrolase [Sinorhizobium meliloti]PST27626.1 alpha/beta hydrolase [Mesorhizobium loti]AEH84377.1 chloride peroxidase [Sinorhizobium meliloti SM11]ARS67879.1 alpha/beta hydrolase [Sinorhizobium meliloti RU11/001]MBP2468603.1 non-heme chloroperoxidase [Sinorhizobium meliloti]MCO6421406.1 alpha/beta hydrolase [Sinorhizobium meliloti]
MATITTRDGTRIFYKDWGSRNAQPILFSHGWPLTADVWDAQMVFFANKGYRVIAHDRRSHGRSDQVWDSNTMDRYADDLAELIEALDLRSVILVGHSTGGGEVTRYVGRHGTGRVAKVALIGAVPPLMLKTEANPGGLPIDVFDGIRKGTYDNRSQFFRDLTIPFYGYNREGAAISEGIRESFWLQGMMGGLKGQLDSIRAFSESDFNADLAKFDKPTLVLHGDDDQIVPIGASALSTVKIVKHAVLKVYEGADHGLTQTYQDRFNADLLEFIEA